MPKAAIQALAQIINIADCGGTRYKESEDWMEPCFNEGWRFLLGCGYEVSAASTVSAGSGAE